MLFSALGGGGAGAGTVVLPKNPNIFTIVINTALNGFLYILYKHNI
jgi:hypothetical protein